MSSNGLLNFDVMTGESIGNYGYMMSIPNKSLKKWVGTARYWDGWV